eukprot:365942-Chlamydomonas_euryale.AAC.1
MLQWRRKGKQARRRSRRRRRRCVHSWSWRGRCVVAVVVGVVCHLTGRLLQLGQRPHLRPLRLLFIFIHPLVCRCHERTYAVALGASVRSRRDGLLLAQRYRGSSRGSRAYRRRCWADPAAYVRPVVFLLSFVVIDVHEAVAAEMLNLKLPHPAVCLVRDKLGAHLGAHGTERALPPQDRWAIAHRLLRLLVQLVHVVQRDLRVGVEASANRRLLGSVGVAEDLAVRDADDAVQTQARDIDRAEPSHLADAASADCEVHHRLEAVRVVAPHRGQLRRRRLKRVALRCEPPEARERVGRARCCCGTCAHVAVIRHHTTLHVRRASCCRRSRCVAIGCWVRICVFAGAAGTRSVLSPA